MGTPEVALAGGIAERIHSALINVGAKSREAGRVNSNYGLEMLKLMARLKHVAGRHCDLGAGRSVRAAGDSGSRPPQRHIV